MTILFTRTKNTKTSKQKPKNEEKFLQHTHSPNKAKPTASTLTLWSRYNLKLKTVRPVNHISHMQLRAMHPHHLITSLI